VNIRNHEINLFIKFFSYLIVKRIGALFEALMPAEDTKQHAYDKGIPRADSSVAEPTIFNLYVLRDGNVEAKPERARTGCVTSRVQIRSKVMPAGTIPLFFRSLGPFCVERLIAS